jgi:hypothetical protein
MTYVRRLKAMRRRGSRTRFRNHILLPRDCGALFLRRFIMNENDRDPFAGGERASGDGNPSDYATGYDPTPGYATPNMGDAPNPGYDPSPGQATPNAGDAPNPGYDPNAGYTTQGGDYTQGNYGGYNPNAGQAAPNPGYDPNAGYGPGNPGPYAPYGANPYSSEIPPEIRRWNWGAFMFNIIWGIGNRAYLTLLTIIPFFGIVWWFVCGARGNRWAWETGNFRDVETFLAAQRTWNRAGIFAFILWIICIVCSFAFYGYLISVIPFADLAYSSYY